MVNPRKSYMIHSTLNEKEKKFKKNSKVNAQRTVHTSSWEKLRSERWLPWNENKKFFFCTGKTLWCVHIFDYLSFSLFMFEGESVGWNSIFIARVATELDLYLLLCLRELVENSQLSETMTKKTLLWAESPSVIRRTFLSTETGGLHSTRKEEIIRMESDWHLSLCVDIKWVDINDMWVVDDNNDDVSRWIVIGWHKWSGRLTISSSRDWFYICMMYEICTGKKEEIKLNSRQS